MCLRYAWGQYHASGQEVQFSRYSVAASGYFIWCDAYILGTAIIACLTVPFFFFSLDPSHLSCCQFVYFYHTFIRIFSVQKACQWLVGLAYVYVFIYSKRVSYWLEGCTHYGHLLSHIRHIPVNMRLVVCLYLHPSVTMVAFVVSMEMSRRWQQVGGVGNGVSFLNRTSSRSTHMNPHVLLVFVMQ